MHSTQVYVSHKCCVTYAYHLFSIIQMNYACANVWCDVLSDHKLITSVNPSKQWSGSHSPQRSSVRFSCRAGECQKTLQKWQARWWRRAVGWTTQWRRCPRECTAGYQKGWSLRMGPSWGFRGQWGDPTTQNIKATQKQEETVSHLSAF